MKLNETGQIVNYLAMIDNRNVTPELITIWHELIGGLSFETARQASILCREDSSIDWIEPRHVLAKSRQVKETHLTNQRREQAIVQPSDKPGVPMPICKHNKGLLYCGLCCHEMAVNAGTIPDRPYRAK